MSSNAEKATFGHSMLNRMVLFWEHIKPGVCIVLHITEEPRDKFLT
jgi:hypothetical protein